MWLRGAVALVVAALGACSSVDESLLAPSERDASLVADGGNTEGGPRAGTGASSDLPDASGGAGGAGGAGTGGAGGMGGSGGVGGAPDASAGCKPNPDETDEVCPAICPEVCNGEDDDCDRRIDEAGPGLCKLAHATSVCVKGECAIVDCLDQRRDCNGVVVDGCEVAQDDPKHCGTCGHKCSLLHAAETCAAGECAVDVCDDGWDDCDSEPLDCETPTNTAENCAGCGLSCDALDHAASVTCATGSCAVQTCVGNFGDCNQTGSDGCEQELNTLGDCGACATPCALNGGTNDCSTGLCKVTGCDVGYAQCDGNPVNGCEPLDTATDCGACATPCSPGALDHVMTATCAVGNCEISCESGFGDCDGMPENGCETELNSLTHCAGCGMGCAIDNAVADCSTGSCEFVICRDGFGDCNTDTDLDGCEETLTTDQRCGSCANDCTVTSDPVCSGGQCADVACPAGTADCNQDGLPCEVTTDTDVSHCGACNNACAFTTGTPHASGLSCVSAACEPSCDATYDDCDADYHNGCEQSLRTTQSCGACNVGCAIANATATCATGSCLVQTCAPDYGDCNNDQLSCETALNTTTHCGACGAACNLPNALPTCGGTPGARVCQIAGCTDAFYKDCDTTAANGCEVDTRTSTANCGACGNDCALKPHVVSASCAASACVFDTCETGWDDCTSGAGCETAVNTVQNCGACGNNCDTALANTATTACNGVSLTCEVATCDPGYADCDGVDATGCEGTDADGDLYADCVEDCDADPLKQVPGMCGCGVPDTDTDLDGFADCVETCDMDPGKQDPGTCGCGTPDADADGDGFLVCQESCDLDPDKQAPGACGCNYADVDADGDLSLDCDDACPWDATRTVVPCTGCWGDASTFDPNDAALVFQADVHLSCSPTIDTSLAVGSMITGWCGPVPTPVIQTQVGGPSIVVIPMTGLVLDAGQTLALRGNKPVVLAVAGDARIAGTIDASSTALGLGAGANYNCTPATANGAGSNGTGTASGGGGGGGGGGFGTAGGSGGDGDGSNNGVGGAARGNASLVPLIAGCPGGNGGAASGSNGIGGGGGGAVQLTVAGTLAVPVGGSLRSTGNAGTLGVSSEGGGGGGGSGGAIFVEATTLAIAGTLNANGGNGGNGRGGTAGAAGSTSAGANGGTAANEGANGGGGGGGGYGRIVQRTLTGSGQCWQTPGFASNVNTNTLSFTAAPTVTLDATCVGGATTTIDTGLVDGSPVFTNWCGATPPWQARAQSGAPQALVIRLTGFTLAAGQTLRLTGVRPVIFAVDGDVTIDGTIDASGRVADQSPGAGGNQGCAGGDGAGGANSGAVDEGSGGGGGAGHARAGATGGTGDGYAGGAGGGAKSTSLPTPLTSGCRGGEGGRSTVAGSGGDGGVGGGAVQWSASGALLVSATGKLSVSGGGGRKAEAQETSGGGGGSGGAIVLEGAGVTLASGSWLSANGGGGGGAGDITNANSANGTDGAIGSASPAAGGAAATGSTASGGAGGVFAYSGGVVQTAVGAVAGVTTTADGDGGGGGGGAFGRIRLQRHP